MKYEISDLLDDKYKYGLTILRMHGKANKSHLLPYIIMKIIICDNIIFLILYIIISSLGFIILSSDFIPDYNKYKYLSTWIRFLTAFSFIEKLNISNYEYIIICSIIFIICIIRLIYMYIFIYKVEHFHNKDVYKIQINIFTLILNHIVYALFSYIIEFLSLIYYIEVIPDNFIIKKDSKLNNITNKLFCFLNSLFIIIYNINNYIFILLINKPTSNDSFSFRMRIPTSKLYVLILFQNIGILHPIQYYLNEKAIRIWCIIYNIIIVLIILWIYFICIKLYNYNNIINTIISLIGEFCFISLIMEFLLFIFSIKHENNIELIFFIFIKLLLTICLHYCLQIIYEKLMIKKIKKRLFYNNPQNLPFDKKLVTSILFIREKMGVKDWKFINKIIEYLNKHKKLCINYNCGCKIIKIKNEIKIDENNVWDKLINKINYYIESILIFYNYQNNFELSLLLSEHFLVFKNNPVMSYSILQTLIHYNYKNLKKIQLITIYEAMNKYIDYILKEKNRKINLEEFRRNEHNINIFNKENEMKEYINLLLKINKADKYMIYYSSRFLNIITHKDNYENSSIAKINEIRNEIKKISSPYLNQKIINELIQFLSGEVSYTINIKKYLCNLEEYKKLLPYEFLYKLFLFVDFFWDRKIPEKLINIFYAFTSNRNLYSNKINPEIYNILEAQNIELMASNKRNYCILFKYTKGLKITYASESLIQKLNFKKTKLIHNDIDALLINDLKIPHANAVKYFFLLKQNNLLKNRYKFIFDSKKNMVKTTINSTLQIGINKNILVICILDINKNKDICLLIDKDSKIISINNNFLEEMSLSLPLIEEFKLELKDIFGIDILNIQKKYKKEIKKVKIIRDFKILDTNEYILKNLFKYQKQNNYYHINNKYIIREDNDDITENEEEKILKEKDKIPKILDNLFNNKSCNLSHIKKIKYTIDNENFLVNLKKIFEKINSYEIDKLEIKNIYNDYLRLNINYNDLIDIPNLFFIISIEPRLIYDTIFYYCKIEKNIVPNIREINSINNNQNDLSDLKKITTETDELNSSGNISLIKRQIRKEKYNENIYNLYKNDIQFGDENKNSEYENAINNSHNFRDKIKTNKPSSNKLCPLLLLCILALLIACIVTFNYQNNLINKNGEIFKVIYYNYYQRTQLIYINSIILSIVFELINITNNNPIEDNLQVLKIIGKNLRNSHQIYKKYFLDIKIELNEDFSILYGPFYTNQITVNWENIIFYENYDSEISLIINKIIDTINHNFTQYDIEDCENLLLHNYLKIESKKTPVYGNFIKLVYYFYKNYDSTLRQYFLNLEDSFDKSLKKFSREITIIIIIIEIIGIFLFLFFFYINLYFLIMSNKYIFQNILYMFIDFTQSKDYLFNNKETNLFIKKKITNYILLLKEFSPKNMEALKYNKDIKNYIDLKTLIEEEKNHNIIYDSKIMSKKIKSKAKKNKVILAEKTNSDRRSISNTSLFKLNSEKSLSNKNNNNNSNIINDDIHILNNKELNDISNNSIIMNNSKNDSTNIILNSSNNNNIEFINKDKKENNNEIKITIDNILFLTRIKMLNSIKIIIIIFIILTFILIIFYICKIIFTLLFISNFQYIINDFKTLTSQYNHIIRYWNHMKSLFILPNSTIFYEFNETEKYFFNLNNKVYNIYNTRIKRYKKISNLYDNILSSSLDNLSNIDFCFGHKRCEKIKNSNTCLLSNGIESLVNIYSKEISNYYKIYLFSKFNITSKEDIINTYINERYKILSNNINHIFIFLELIYYNYFLVDEENIINNFDLIIKIFNIIEICYCLLLNLFSVLFVYNFIIKIINKVEIASARINRSILRMKIQSLDDK